MLNGDEKSKSEYGKKRIKEITNKSFVVISGLLAVILIVIGIIGIIGVDKMKLKIEMGEGSWISVTYIYIGIGLLTFIPSISSIVLKDSKLYNYNVDEINYTKFTDENKKRLIRCNDRIKGTLIFWKGQAKKYKRLHYYSAIWTTLNTVFMPILIQSIAGIAEGKILLTVISAHSAVIVAMHKGFKVENNYRDYRICESNFYDEYRKLLECDLSKVNQDDVVNQYIEKINMIRKAGRAIEIDNMPNISESENETNTGSKEGENET